MNSLYSRPTFVEINLENLTFNFNSVKSFTGRNMMYMAVIKADAYGHSIERCALKLEKENVDWFGVAIPEEGLVLRNVGIKKPILCLGGFWKEQSALLVEHNITPVIFQLEQAQSFNEAAKRKGKICNYHFKVDSGMNRNGLRFDEVSHFIGEIKHLKDINLEGVMTHFAVADDTNQKDFTDLQIKRFQETINLLENNGFQVKIKHLTNSPGTVIYKNSQGNLARLGGMLYGLGDDILPKNKEKPALKPVLSLYSQISDIKLVHKNESVGYGRTFISRKDSKIATVPIGYYDGYCRALSNKSRVIINEKFAPVIGRVSMDWITVDISDIPNAKKGDKVILIGEQNGLVIKAEDLAEIAGTISYEITCGIKYRVPRKFIED